MHKAAEGRESRMHGSKARLRPTVTLLAPNAPAGELVMHLATMELAWSVLEKSTAVRLSAAPGSVRDATD